MGFLHNNLCCEALNKAKKLYTRADLGVFGLQLKSITQKLSNASFNVILEQYSNNNFLGYLFVVVVVHSFLFARFYNNISVSHFR